MMQPMDIPKISFWSRLTNLISPRSCTICGNRLGLAEDILCGNCNLHLPRTHYILQPQDNEMAQLFWGRLSVERAVALIHYNGGSQVSNIIYQLKYGSRPDTGLAMGQLMGIELLPYQFFQDIDLIIPIPLARSRRLQRGYNQSQLIAEGVSLSTGIRMSDSIVCRSINTPTQTHKDRWERADNVEDAFTLLHPEAAKGRHLLLIDDVVTTGSTLCACGKALQQAGEVKISVLTLGFSRG